MKADYHCSDVPEHSLSFLLENFQTGKQEELWFLIVKYQAYSANGLVFPGNSQLIFQTQGWSEGD